MVGTMQRYERIYDYIHEYQQLLYDFYSKHVVAFLVNYYNIDLTNTVWDDENLMGGSYEQIGSLSGIEYNKILLLPVYYSEEILPSFDAQDIGYVKETNTNFVIPSTYNFTPYPGDILKLEAEYLNPTNDNYPLYRVEGVEISVEAQRRFWKLRCEVFQSATLNDIEPQVSNTYTFVEYDKIIHTLADSEFMAKLLIKAEKIKYDLVNCLFDNRAGFYFRERQERVC